MIGKLERGGSFRGLAEYLLDAEDHKGEARVIAEVIGGTITPMPGSNDPGRDLSRQFGALRRLRPDYKNPVCHQIFRLADADVGKISQQHKCDIASEWAEAMGYQAFVVVDHGQDWHLEGSRINPDGGVVSDSWEIRRSEKIMHELRAEYGLTEIAPSHLIDRDSAINHRRAPTRSQIEMAAKGEVPPSQIIANLIDELVAEGPCTAPRLAEYLESAGVTVRPNLASTGKFSGFSYDLDGIVVTAKAMGKGYTWGSLEKKGIGYVKDRDFSSLRERVHGAAQAGLGIPGADAADDGGDGGGDAANATAKPTSGGVRSQVGSDGPSFGAPGRGDEGQLAPEPARVGGVAEGIFGEQERQDRGVGPHEVGPQWRDQEAGHGGHVSDGRGQQDDIDDGRRDSQKSDDRTNSRGAFDRISMLADFPEPAVNGPVLGLEDHNQSDAPVKRDRTREAVNTFLEALPDDLYIVGIRNPTTDRMMRREWSAAEILKNLAWLKRQNAMGREIYSAPTSDRYALVDDVSMTKIAAMTAAGYEPALVAETSKNNYQAWVAFEPGVTPEERTALGKALAQKFDADPASTGRQHLGRLPGLPIISRAAS